MTDQVQFPDDFVWGSGTSALQIEGSLAADGRGRPSGRASPGGPAPSSMGPPSTWPVTATGAGRTTSLLDETGLTAYRFSLAWPRLLPEGTGAVNEAGVAFYDRAIDHLLASGVEPVPTLFHWDLPAALHERGGWEDRRMLDWFDAYATLVAERYGDRLHKVWLLNEPNYVAWLGYRLGSNAPGTADPDAFLRVVHHQNLVTARAAARMRAVRPVWRSAR